MIEAWMTEGWRPRTELVRGWFRARWLPLLLGAAVTQVGCADARSPRDAAPRNADPDAPRAIASMLDDFHDAAAKADESRYFAHLAEDSIFLGTDATERWSKKAFFAFAHPHFAKGKAWSFHSIRRDIVVDGEGRAAHFDEDLATEKLGPARGSGVVAYRSGAWVIVQYNLALTIPNERFGEAHRAVSAVLLEPDSGPLAPYAWLSGDWVSDANGERTEELWSEPHSGTMIGMARTTRDGKTTFFEALRIEARASGLVLIARPQGEAEAELTMPSSSRGDTTALHFENAGHDFPQRIEYRKSGEELVAHIEGGGPASEWHYRRAIVAAH